MGVSLHDTFKPLFTSKKRYFLITGGRGSSKSFTVKTFEALLTYEKGHKILDTRYTLKSAEKSTIPEFTGKLSLLEREEDFTITKDIITNKTSGSSVLFSGIKTSSGNQTANLKSLEGITTWVLDEAEELVDEDEFDTIDLSIRQSGVQNRVILILNPTTKEHWIWKRWFEGHSIQEKHDDGWVEICNHPDVEHIHSTYLINKSNLSESFLKNIETIKNTNPEKYRHRILGGWLDRAEGVIFDNWEEGEFDNSLTHIYGMDFGVEDPDTLTKVAVDEKNKKLYVKEMLYKNGLSTTELVSRLDRCLTSRNELIIADSAGKRAIKDIREAGFNIRKAKKGHDSIRNGIKQMMDYQIIVDPQSHNIKKELRNYVWNDKKSETPVDDYNHAIDGIRYAVMYLKNYHPAIIW